MEDSTDAGLRRTGDHVADLAVDRLARMNLEGRAGTRVDPTLGAFEVRRVDHPLGVVLTLGGELDLAAVGLLQEQLDRAIRAGGAVVIDLSGLRFIDSSALNVLVQAERQLRPEGSQLALVYGSRAVRRVFELTGLDHYFALADSPSAALRMALERRNGSRGIPARRRPTDRGRAGR